MLIRKLEESQIDAAADVLVRAFFDSPVWTWVAPDEQRRRGIMPWFMRRSLSDGVRAGRTYVYGEPIVGVAKWDPPSGDGEIDAGTDANAGWDELAARMGSEAMARFNAMAEAHRPAGERATGGAPTWYLRLLAVEPAVQRTGTGAALLGDMFARADATGIPYMLDTAKEANVPYYERHGFVVVETFTVPFGGPRFWLMRREAPGHTFTFDRTSADRDNHLLSHAEEASHESP